MLKDEVRALEGLIKYFTMSVLHPTSNTDREVYYVCKVVDESYHEIFNETLSKEDTNMFLEIVSDNKYALLYRTHPNEGIKNLCMFKIDKHANEPIKDGLQYP